MTDIDHETRAAVAALVFRLRNPGDADPLGADAEPFAEEFMAALKARGWRPVHAVPPDADWRRASGNSRTPRGSMDPEVRAALMTQCAEASQATRNGKRATGPQPVLDEGNDRKEAG